MTGLLYPYQQRWLDDERSRFKIGMFARQTGKTFTTALEIVDELRGGPSWIARHVRWVILSRGERQAREAMEEGVKLHLRASGCRWSCWRRTCGWTPSPPADRSGPSPRAARSPPCRPTRTPRAALRQRVPRRVRFPCRQPGDLEGAAQVVDGLRLRVTSTPNGKNNRLRTAGRRRQGVVAPPGGHPPGRGRRARPQHRRAARGAGHDDAWRQTSSWSSRRSRGLG